MTQYLIWSNEHRAWWRPSKAGYTPFIEEAGRWPEGEARTIVARCTLGGRLAYPMFNEQTREAYTGLSEYAVPAPEVWETTIAAAPEPPPTDAPFTYSGVGEHGLIYERATFADGTLGQAVFSTDRRYRYTLGRRWSAGDETQVWVMLNPSTAGASTDDATIRKCVGYAKRWGYSAMTVVNLFALIATNPNALWQELDPVGPDNDQVLREAFRPAPDGPPSDVMVAWGDTGVYRDRATAVADLLDAAGCRPFCIGTTRHGQPKHPGRTAYALERVLWERPLS